jgi:hypothetical protein
LRIAQLGFDNGDLGRAFACTQVAELGLGLRQLRLRLADRGRLGGAVLAEQRRAGVHRIAAPHRQRSQLAALLGGDQNGLALHIALKAGFLGGLATRQQRHEQKREGTDAQVHWAEEL